MEYRMTNTAEILDFLFSGKAEFTIKSAASGKHWAFKANLAKDSDRSCFVRVKHNDDSYYIGLLDTHSLSYIPKQRGDSSTAIAALAAFLRRGELHPQFEFYHIGKCARCSRPLTDPASIQRGLGPTCVKK